MKLIYPVTKKIIEQDIIKNSKNIKENFFLLSDKLKEFGFNFAKFSGFSIGINDICGYINRNYYFFGKDKELEDLTTVWTSGKISNNEYYSFSLDIWSSLFFELRTLLISFYETNKFYTNLNIMILSGSRGDWPQALQLTEFRGLMLDQDGKLLEIPVNTNFKQGLSLLDYCISTYSSRKGIIDTAQKTATSGYLTRRLVFLAQESIIKIKDCFTEKKLGCLITNNFLQLKKKSYIEYKKNNFRTVISCNSFLTVCQKCYGFNKINNRLIALGNAIGIIGAQSISEPTTQMTLKTFHTGGAASNNSAIELFNINKSSRLLFPNKVFGSALVENYFSSEVVLKKKQKIVTKTWNGLEKTLTLLSNSNLFTDNFIIKDNYYYKSPFLTGSAHAKMFQPFLLKKDTEINFFSGILKKEHFNNYNYNFINSVTFLESYIGFSNIKVNTFNLEILILYLKNLFTYTSFINLKLLNKIDKQYHIFKENKFTLKKNQKFLTNSDLNNNILFYQYSDLFTLNKFSKIVKDKNSEIFYKIKNNNFISFSLITNKEYKYKNFNMLKKISLNSYLSCEPGDTITALSPFGYSSFLNNRDQDIIDTTVKLNLVLNFDKTITHTKIFSPYLKISKLNKENPFILNNLLALFFNLKFFFKFIFFYNEKRYSNIKSILTSVKKFEMIISNTFTAMYAAQETFLLPRHFDLIIKKLTSFSYLKNSIKTKHRDLFNIRDNIYLYKTKFFNELDKTNLVIKKTHKTIFLSKKRNFFSHKNWINYKIQLFLLNNFYKNIKINLKKWPLPLNKITVLKKNGLEKIMFKPTFLKERNLISMLNQFLLNTTFHDGTIVLAKAALNGTTNWIGGLRESVILNSNASAGSNIYGLKESFSLNYFFKNK